MRCLSFIEKLRGLGTFAQVGDPRALWSLSPHPGTLMRKETRFPKITVLALLRNSHRNRTGICELRGSRPDSEGNLSRQMGV